VPKLNQFRDDDGNCEDFYFDLGQVLTYKDRFFRHQRRYSDSFGTEPLGHWLIDEKERSIKMVDDTLSAFRIAANRLISDGSE
jgi:hypothetical protein